MHVAFLIHDLTAGGAERVLSALANNCVSAGHRVSIFTFANGRNKPFYPLHPAIHLYPLDVQNRSRSWFVRLIAIVKRLVKLREETQRIKPDVFVSFIDLSNISAILALMGTGIPVIISERIDPNYHQIPFIFQCLRGLTYPLCTKLVMQTRGGASYFTRPRIQKKIVVIPNPVDRPPQYKDKTQQQSQKIITIGRLEHQKNHVFLIRAFARLVGRFPHMHLTIYGEGPLRPTLENLVKELHLQDHVSLPGLEKDIYGALTARDIFVFPSLYEGFPNALCEAMSVGLPVIASNCSGNRDVVRDGIDGYLFPTDDGDALIDRMERLMAAPSTQASMGERAREICDRFHPDRIFGMWNDLIKAVSLKTD